MSNVTVLHTRDRAVADTEAFVAPLKTARGVWFGGGRQWRLVDAYMGTRTQREIEGVLARGGVVGGSSAGATIQGSYLVRGAREGNHIMMAKGYEEGFGYLRGVAIDQHLLVRGRQDDLVERHRGEARAARHRARRADGDRRQGRSLPGRRPERGRHLRRQGPRRQAVLTSSSPASNSTCGRAGA